MPSAGVVDVMLYVESSAVLAWLLGEPSGERVGEALEAADGVMASDPTLIECERVLIRAWSSGLLTEAERVDQSRALALVSSHRTRLRVEEVVVERARRPFPIEPVRRPDALHLSTALVARSVAPGLAVLSLDQRLRENAERLGLVTVP